MSHQVRCEQLGEGRCDCLLPGPQPTEVDVSVDGEADAGKDARAVGHLCLGDAGGGAQLKPSFQPALMASASVVVDDSRQPAATLIAVRQFRQDQAVLDRDRLLVVVAVADPAA